MIIVFIATNAHTVLHIKETATQHFRFTFQHQTHPSSPTSFSHPWVRAAIRGIPDFVLLFKNRHNLHRAFDLCQRKMLKAAGPSTCFRCTVRSVNRWFRRVSEFFSILVVYTTARRAELVLVAGSTGPGTNRREGKCLHFVSSEGGFVMSRQWILGVVALAMACTVLASDAWARRAPGRRERPEADPAALAEKCIERVSTMAERCAGHNAGAAEGCVAKIEKLLEDGLTEDAETVAERCIRRINRSSHRCVSAIRHTCRQCIRMLRRLEDRELVEQVEAACESAVEQVRQSREDAVAAIEAAL